MLSRTFFKILNLMLFKLQSHLYKSPKKEDSYTFWTTIGCYIAKLREASIDSVDALATN